MLLDPIKKIHTFAAEKSVCVWISALSCFVRRLQALAADGTCWLQPAYQQASSSSRSRSFWDLSALEGQSMQAAGGA
jgi:hypothetical protein